jgi:hypothetical protein
LDVSPPGRSAICAPGSSPARCGCSTASGHATPTRRRNAEVSSCVARLRCDTPLPTVLLNVDARRALQEVTTTTTISSATITLVE